MRRLIICTGHNHLARCPCATATPGENVRCSVALGSFNLAPARPSIATCTPAGTVTGNRPIRDTVIPPSPWLPDLAEDFAANTQLAGPLSGHDTLRESRGWQSPSQTEPREYPVLWVYTRRPGRLIRSKPVITGLALAAFANVFQAALAGPDAGGFSPSTTSKPSINPSSFRIRAISTLILELGIATSVWPIIKRCGYASTYQQSDH